MINKIYKESALAIPATMLDTAEVFSEIFHTPAQTRTEAFLYVADTSKTATSLVLTVYASVDGIDFYAADSVTISNGTGAASGAAVALIAPYSKVGVKSNGALSASHGAKVEVYTGEEAHNVKSSVGTVEVTEAGNESLTLEMPNFFEKVTLQFISTGGAIDADSFDYNILTSADGVTWFAIATVTNKDEVDFADLISYDDEGLMKYVKFQAVALAGTSTVATVQVLMAGIGY